MRPEVLEIYEVELKYCERCGGLWLRRKGEMEVYCAACLPWMEEMASWTPRERFTLPSEKIEGVARTSFFAGEGGEA